MSLTRESINNGVRDGRWSHSSGQDILDLFDRATMAEAERDGYKLQLEGVKALAVEAEKAHAAELAKVKAELDVFATVDEQRRAAIERFVEERDEARATAAQHEKALEAKRGRVAHLETGLRDALWVADHLADILNDMDAADEDDDFDETTRRLTFARAVSAAPDAGESVDLIKAPGQNPGTACPICGIATPHSLLSLERENIALNERGNYTQAQAMHLALNRHRDVEFPQDAQPGLRLYADLIHVLNGGERELEPGAKASLAAHDAQVEAKARAPLLALLRNVNGLLDDVDQGPRTENSTEWRIPWSRHAVEVFTDVARALASKDGTTP